MSTAPTLAPSYEALRPKVLERRATLGPSLGRLDEATARAQIDAVLVTSGVHRHGRSRPAPGVPAHIAGDARGRGPERGLRARDAGRDRRHGGAVAQEDSTGDSGGTELTLLLTRVTASTARAVNDLIAEELNRRERQRTALGSRARQDGR